VSLGVDCQQRAQPVIYLGSSPKHTSLVALVLDLATAQVSPQFHLKFDDLFETVSASRTNLQAQQSSWQHLCHFEKVKEEAFRAPESAAIAPKQGDNIGCAGLLDKLLIEPDLSIPWV
jgi:hypothetical protein